MIFNLTKKDLIVITGGVTDQKEEVQQDEVTGVDMTKTEFIWRSGQLITIVSFVVGCTIFAMYNKCKSANRIKKRKKD